MPEPRNLPINDSGVQRTGLSATWSSQSQKLTSSPGQIPNRSRNSLGITTCPFAPTV